VVGIWTKIKKVHELWQDRMIKTRVCNNALGQSASLIVLMRYYRKFFETGNQRAVDKIYKLFMQVLASPAKITLLRASEQYSLGLQSLFLKQI
jgi:hypothetical protein